MSFFLCQRSGTQIIILGLAQYVNGAWNLATLKHLTIFMRSLYRMRNYMAQMHNLLKYHKHLRTRVKTNPQCYSLFLGIIMIAKEQINIWISDLPH